MGKVFAALALLVTVSNVNSTCLYLSMRSVM
ncbi:AgrD family cyclic lactone autoinducer peptide [Ruminococcus sp.]